MIKAIAFDLDGVLVQTPDIHFDALNFALGWFGFDRITRAQHDTIYNGLPTAEKLRMLDIPEDYRRKINDIKQRHTQGLLKSQLEINPTVIETVKKFKEDGYKLYCCSNAVFDTVKTCLTMMGIYELFNGIFANESVAKHKPYPEIYLNAVIDAECATNEMLVIEDNEKGVTAAEAAGCMVEVVSGPHEVTYDRIKQVLNLYNTWGRNSEDFVYTNHNLNVVIPMAGAGKRFFDEGYKICKPLIPINGTPMISAVINSLRINTEDYIFLCQEEHLKDYPLRYILENSTFAPYIIPVNGLTDGAASTVLLAKKYIDNQRPLFCINSDQIIHWSPKKFFEKMETENADGGVLTFKANHHKWSYVKTDENDVITEVAEKKVISNRANVGGFYFRHGKDCVWAIEEMKRKQIKVNGEYYFSVCINELIAKGQKFLAYNVDEMHGTGTPEDLQEYINGI